MGKSVHGDTDPGFFVHSFGFRVALSRLLLHALLPSRIGFSEETVRWRLSPWGMFFVFFSVLGVCNAMRAVYVELWLLGSWAVDIEQGVLGWGRGGLV